MVVLLSHFLILVIGLRFQRRSKGCWGGGHALITLWLILFWSIFALGMVPFWRQLYYINFTYYIVTIGILIIYVALVLIILLIISMSPYKLESISWWSFHAQFCKQLMSAGVSQYIKIIIYQQRWWLREQHNFFILFNSLRIAICIIISASTNMVIIYLICVGVRLPGFLNIYCSLNLEKFFFCYYWYNIYLYDIANILVVFYIWIIVFARALIIYTLLTLIVDHCFGLIPRFLSYRVTYNLYYNQDIIYHDMDMNNLSLQQPWHRAGVLKFYEFPFNWQNFHNGAADWPYKYNSWRPLLINDYRSIFLSWLSLYDLDIFYVFGYNSEVNLYTIG